MVSVDQWAHMGLIVPWLSSYVGDGYRYFLKGCYFAPGGVEGSNGLLFCKPSKQGCLCEE
jgi:hypothetical protein